MEKQLGQSTTASYGQLHIFCPDQAGAQRRVGNSLGSGRNLPISKRHARRQSPVRSPTKFELAAVAALCKPRSSASPSRCRVPQACHFPSALAFVPGRQLPCTNPPAVGAGLATLCNTPISTIRRPERGNNRAPQQQGLTGHKASPVRAHVLPVSASPTSQSQWEASHPPRRDGGWPNVERFEQTTMEGGLSAWRTSNGQPPSPASFRWQCQPPDGASSLEGIPKSMEGAAGRAAAWNVTSHSLPYIAIAEQPLGSNAFFPGNGTASLEASAEADALLWQRLGRRPAGCLPLARQAGATPHGRTEEAHELTAGIVTVHGTERFWQLMETLVELQRGPTSLLSSSVTFDSMLLPGGELQYALIEQGSFGKVFVGSHQGNKVAIKVPVESMLRSDAAGVMERTLNEWQILSMCQHPNVVRLVGGIVHGPFDVWLVTELANGSDLHSRKYSRDPLVQRAITPENGLYMCRQLAAVVAYLHCPIPGRKPIVVHRDIKPENVLVADDWSIQLCDFGDAEASADGRVSRISGATWFYAPAELLRCSPVECMTSDSGRQLPPLNEKWDVWSMGCVFQEMFGLLNPMHVHISSRDSPHIIYQKLKSKAIAGTLVPVIADEIQGIARSIISKCLDLDPESRPSAADVLQMWNANDEEILKDIYLGKNGSQRNFLVEAGSCSSSHLPRWSDAVPGHQQLTSNTVLPSGRQAVHFNPDNPVGAGNDALYGQLRPATAGRLAGASAELQLNSRVPDYAWKTNARRTSLHVPAPFSRSPVAKQGARCVQPQPISAAVGRE